MSLFTQTLGSGADVVMLHGWAMHSGLWLESAQRLARNWKITLIDLPGHGRSSTWPDPYSIENIVRLILNNAPAQAHWLGWSLGGLISQYIALHHPERVRKLILVASSARFIRAHDWPHAMAPELLEQFAAGLQHDYRATLLRFVALEVQGSSDARNELRHLRQQVFDHGAPQSAALQGALDILRSTDLRARIGELPCPVCLIMGQRDALVPVDAGAAMLRRIAHARLHVIERAGHAPFLSHGEVFVNYVNEFLHE